MEMLDPLAVFSSLNPSHPATLEALRERASGLINIADDQRRDDVEPELLASY